MCDIGNIILTKDDLRAALRFELPLSELLQDGGPESVLYEAAYDPDLWDLEAAMVHMQEKRATWQEYHDWYETLFCSPAFSEAYCMSALRAKLAPSIYILATSEPELFSDVFYELGSYLDDAWMGEADENGCTEFQEAFPFREIMEEIRYFREDRELDPEDRRYTADQMKMLISYLSYDENLKAADGKLVRMYRRFLDTLCDAGVEYALKEKAYACYEGNAAYEQDWYASRDCLLKHYELTGDKFTANTLGYIYYYGRCNDGVPQYEEAFRYFSIGAAGGVYESIYKLGDMFTNGYAVQKSPETAHQLYRFVYDENLERFRQGETEGKFADAALRMAASRRNAQAFGYDLSEYGYALQAELAIRKRMETVDYYGDNVVLSHILEELEAAKLRYHEAVPAAHKVCSSLPDLFDLASDNGKRRVSVRIKALKDGRIRFKLRPLPNPGEAACPKLLLTFPQADYCALEDKLVITAEKVKKIRTLDGTDSFVYTHVEHDFEKDLDIFLLFEEPVAKVRAKRYVIRVPRPEAEQERGQGQEQEYRFAGVTFQPGGRQYDYLCDDAEIRTGDQVIVEGSQGETEVKVVKIFTCKEEDLVLPLERYKTVLRKAPEDVRRDIQGDTL